MSESVDAEKLDRKAFRELLECTGKVAFSNRALAEQIAKRRRQHGKGRLTVYRCSSCGQFHIGSRA